MFDGLNYYISLCTCLAVQFPEPVTLSLIISHCLNSEQKCMFHGYPVLDRLHNIHVRLYNALTFVTPFLIMSDFYKKRI